MSNTTIDWQDIRVKLCAPFDPADVDFRPQGKPGKSGKVQAVCYIDARTVADRLDDVVGPGAWEFTYEPLVTANGQVQIAKGRLTIHGVTKEDVGEASNFDPSKGCVSDALKRAAVLWGVGRYLYGIGGEWVTPDEYGRMSADDVRRLRGKLPRPDGIAPVRPASPPARRDAPSVSTDASSRPQATPAASQTQTDKPAVQLPAVPGVWPATPTDPLALTHASAQDQRKLVEALRKAGYTTQTGVQNLLLHATGRMIPAAALSNATSDITLHEINRVNEFLNRVPANGKAAW